MLIYQSVANRENVLSCARSRNMYPCIGEVAFKPLRLVRDILDKGEQLSWGEGGEAEHIIAPR